jgi:hypothetical protein
VPSRLRLPALWLLVVCGIPGAAGAAAQASPRTGDLVFQTSHSAQSRAIQLATGSPLSHVGIVVVEGDGRVRVLEAVQPVRLTPWPEWVAQGAKGSLRIKRLREEERLLDPAGRRRMIREGRKHLGRDYDPYFGWSDDTMYCSELVWKIYRRALGIELAPLQRLRDFDLTAPEVRARLKERYGSAIPFEQQVIAPSALWSSTLLVDVSYGALAPNSATRAER